MMMQKFIARTVLTLALLTAASPALASDFSGMIYYLLGAFLLIERDQRIHIELAFAAGQRGFKALRVFANQFYIMHG